MKRIFVIASLIICLFVSKNAAGQCTNFDGDYPGGIQTITSSWQYIDATWAGDYSRYDVVTGETYIWSLCAADGGDAGYDSQLTLYNETDLTTEFALGDNECGDDAKITWTATFTGTVRILISEYDCISNFIDSRLGYKSLPGALSAGSILSDQTVCSGGNPAAFTSVPAAGGAGPITYQWESTSVTGCASGWADIPGATNEIYDVPAGISQTTCFRRKATDGITTVTSNGISVSILDLPIIATTTPNSRCGTGAVILGATASAGTVTWWDAPTAGANLGTGTNYTTPSISATTTYYVDATDGSCTTASRTAVTATVNPCLTVSFSAASSSGDESTSPVNIEISLDNTYASDITVDYTVTGGTATGGGVDYILADGFATIVAGNTTTNITILIIDDLIPEADETIIVTLSNPTSPAILGTNTTYTYTIIDNESSQPPEPPVATGASRCGSGTVTLSASGATGSETYNWYNVSTGGTSVGTGSAFTTPILNQTDTFYVTIDSSGIESSRVEVIATVNDIPVITGTVQGSRCDAGTVTLGASASAGTVNWWDAASGGTNLGTGTNYTTPSIGVTSTYYVDATASGCTTASRTSIMATVNTTPTVTSVTSASRCGTGSVTLGATGSTGLIYWYNVSSGGVSVGTGTSYITPAISLTTVFYVEAVLSECTTPSRTPVTATINPIPTILTTTPASRCGAGTVTLGATASAGIVNWYSVSTGGTSMGTGTNFITPSISATTLYYVDATSGGCTTASRTSVAAIVNTSPSITGATPGSRCDAGTVTLGATASAGIVNWYSVSTGGTSMGTGTNFITPSISATTLYYVDATSGGCTTASRTSVAAIVNTSPSITGATPGSRCDAGTVTLGATASAGIVNWYSVSTGGTSMGTGTNFITPSISATTLYYVDATSGGCTTASRTAITATVNTTPSITSTTPGSRCDAGTVTLGATASVGTVNWYNVATGGTSIGTGTSFTTPYILATTSYYTDATQNGCTTTSRTTVVAEVINSPAVNLGSDTILCSNGYLLDAGNNGAHYLWNTGDTTSAIITAYSGQYSVTVTGSTGCTASDTIMLVINPEFIVNLGPDTFLCNNSPVTITINNAGLIYLWNTGSTQQSITVNTAGYYSVTVTDNNGCNAADSIQVIYSKGIIKGKITYNNLPVANNNLSIHVYSTTLNTRGGYDEVTAPITVFGQGEYKITGLTSDNYIVKVFLNNHTNEYLNVLNSYYSSDTLASDWATASEIIINCDTVTADINIGSRISNGLAFGHIRGGVYYTVSGTKEFTETDTLGNPVSGADIFIERKTDHLAIFNTCTDAGGKFEVKNIYWGEYTVRVDIAGFDQLATYSINIHNADTIYRNLNFIVDTTAGSGFIDTVRILSSPFIESDVSSIIIYPNPFSEELYLECNILKQSSASCRVEIYNISGSLVFSETEKQNAGTIKLKVELNHFSPGVYFIKLRAGNTIFIRKIVKTE